MKTLVFDTSSIITLATNNLLWIAEPLQKKFKGKFYIPASVRQEIIDDPLQSKRFKFEAMQVLREIEKGVFTLYKDAALQEEVKELHHVANHIFKARGNYLRILHSGEIGALLLAEKLGAEALVIDERTTRLLVESPRSLAKFFGKRFNTTIKIDGKNLKLFQERFENVKIIRSVELGIITYELGLLNDYLIEKGKRNPKLRKDLLEAILWGMKLRGCSISENEIKEIINSELT